MLHLSSFWKYPRPVNEKKPFGDSINRNVVRRLYVITSWQEFVQIKGEIEIWNFLVMTSVSWSTFNKNYLRIITISYEQIIFVRITFISKRSISLSESIYLYNPEASKMNIIRNRIGIPTQAIKAEPIHFEKPLCQNVAIWSKMDAVPDYWREPILMH